MIELRGKLTLLLFFARMRVFFTQSAAERFSDPVAMLLLLVFLIRVTLETHWPADANGMAQMSKGFHREKSVKVCIF